MVIQGSKLLGFWMSGIPQNGGGNPNLKAGFPVGSPGLVGRWTTLYWGCFTGNPVFVREIQILRQVFQTENQILIVISSPVIETAFHDHDRS